MAEPIGTRILGDNVFGHSVDHVARNPYRYAALAAGVLLTGGAAWRGYLNSANVTATFNSISNNAVSFTSKAYQFVMTHKVESGVAATGLAAAYIGYRLFTSKAGDNNVDTPEAKLEKAKSQQAIAEEAYRSALGLEEEQELPENPPQEGEQAYAAYLVYDRACENLALARENLES